MLPWFREHFGAPAAFHGYGLKARDALAASRCRVGEMIGIDPGVDEVIFTSSGTEAANLGVKGTAMAAIERGRHLVATAVEHPAVRESLRWLAAQGFEISWLPPDPLGRISPDAVAAALTSQTTLVCVQHTNQDIGTIQPIAEISQITHARGIPLFVDATFSGGWVPIDASALGADLMALSPHRFYGPKGVGILYRHRHVPLAPQIHGGNQENHRRAGTENMPAIVGAGVAAEFVTRSLENYRSPTAELQARLFKDLRERIPLLRLNGPEPGPQRHPSNLNLSIEFTEGEGLALMCDLKGIAFGSGTACLIGSTKQSHVLEAIGLPRELAAAAILLALGKDTTAAEADYVIETLPKVVHKLRSMSPAWDEYQRGEIHSQIPPVEKSRN